MTLSRTILTLMTGTAIALGTVGYGSQVMAAEGTLSADELTMQAFEQMQSGSSAIPAKTKPTEAPITAPSMTGPSMTGPAIAVPSNVGAVLSAPSQPVAQNTVKEQQVRPVAAVPPSTIMPNIPVPRTDGVEIDLGVLNNAVVEPRAVPVQKVQAKPQSVAPVLDTPATIEVSSKTHPGKNTAVSGLLTAPEAVAVTSTPTIATLPAKTLAQAPAPKIEVPKAAQKSEIATVVTPREPAVKTVPSKPISAPKPQQLAQKPQVEIRDVVVAASAPKQGTVSTNPDGYTAIIAPKPQKTQPKAAPEIVKAEPPPLPPEAEKVIAQIENMPANAPRAPDAGATTSFPISMKGKTDSPGIDRVLMQTGRIASDTITLSKVQSTDPSVPPVPASPVATVAAAPTQEPAPEKKPDAPVVATAAVKAVEPEETKPAPIILSKTPEPEAQPEEILAETVAPKAEPIKTRIVKVQKIAKNAPIPAEKPTVTAKTEEDPVDNSAADMAAITPAAGEKDEAVAEKVAIDAPVPGRRPAIQNASIEFVERARRTYQAGEVYRVATRTTGDEEFEQAAPAYKATASYSGGAIPAPTLSVADLGSDPLARQVVDMSAEDIAVALNNIETAAGTGAMMKNNSARPYGTAYDQMPVVQRGFIFRPKEREKEAAAEREAMQMAQNDATIDEPHAEQAIVTSEAPVAAPAEKPRTLNIPPRPPVVTAPVAPEPMMDEPEQKRTDASADNAEETIVALAERPDAPRPGRKPVAEDQMATVDLNSIEPAAKGDSAEDAVVEETSLSTVATDTIGNAAPVSLSYDKGVGTVSDDVLAESMGDVLSRMKGNSDLRVQIVAFASPVDNSQSGSRRTALSRALNVRAWMMENGIDPSRMDVRALGINPDAPDTDRVDMVIVDQKKN